MDKADMAAAHQKTLVPWKKGREWKQVCRKGAEKDPHKGREGRRMVAEDFWLSGLALGWS